MDIGARVLGLALEVVMSLQCAKRISGPDARSHSAVLSCASKHP
jgi:hypothetical protein